MNKFPTFLSNISTEFHLSQEDIKLLDSYYLLHWSASWLLKQAKNDLTTVEHSDTIYLINWRDIDPDKIYGQLRISFRKPFCSSFGFAIIEQIIL